MQTRRSFLKTAAAAVAGVAVAPFVPKVAGEEPAKFIGMDLAAGSDKMVPFWYQTSRWASYKSPAYLKALWRIRYRHLRLFAKENGVSIQAVLNEYYSIVRERDRDQGAWVQSFFWGKRIV